jgi:calcineurin-like phosphoesterase
MDIQQALNRAILQTPHKFILADRDYRLNGVLLELNPETGKAIRLERVSVSIEG